VSTLATVAMPGAGKVAGSVVGASSVTALRVVTPGGGVSGVSQPLRVTPVSNAVRSAGRCLSRLPVSVYQLVCLSVCALE